MGIAFSGKEPFLMGIAFSGKEPLSFPKLLRVQKPHCLAAASKQTKSFTTMINGAFSLVMIASFFE